METKEQVIKALKEAQAKIRELEEKGQRVDELEAKVTELEEKLAARAKEDDWEDW